MVRLRILKFLLPALLLPFVILLILTFRPRPAAIGSAPAVPRRSTGPQAEGVEVTEMWTGERRLFLRARQGEIDDEGRLRLEGLERVEVDREGKSPLVLRAERGVVEGATGRRKMRLEGGIEAGEVATVGVHFFIPVLELDEEEGVARSEGPVRFEGSGYHGTATALVYGLGGQRPSEVLGPSIEGTDGSRMTAERAVFRQDSGRLELEGNVHVVQGTSVMDASRIEVERGPEGRPRNAVASGAVRCVGLPVAGLPSSLRADRVRIEWDAEGRPTRALAEGRPALARAAQALEADTIDLARRPGTEAWDLEARGTVLGTGRFEASPARLSADRIVAEIDGTGRLLRGEAFRPVRFAAGGSSGEAAHASFDATDGAGVVRLESAPGSPARLARDRTRIAAQTIVTDPRGTRLEAEGQVEASLLAAGRASAAARGSSSLFAASEAVHFVADRLDGNPSAGTLRFRGTVRGWQGERNLAAETVELDQKKDELHATTAVTSRFPRQSTATVAQADFVQIAADRLDYSGATGHAEYGGTSRVRVSEGWLEGNTLEVDLDAPGGAAREMRMAGDVRFEMRPSAGHDGNPPVTGHGDRLVYRATDRLVRLFGDTAPASITQGGPQGGTTHGRVLRYRLDVGTLDVEAEDRDDGRGADSGG